jgi:hypothetical protein
MFRTLLFYNQKSGTARFYNLVAGSLQELSGPTTWRKSWALITDI